MKETLGCNSNRHTCISWFIKQKLAKHWNNRFSWIILTKLTSSKHIVPKRRLHKKMFFQSGECHYNPFHSFIINCRQRRPKPVYCSTHLSYAPSCIAYSCLPVERR